MKRMVKTTQSSKNHYFNSDEARQRLLDTSLFGPIRVQIIKKPQSCYNEYCFTEGIVIDIQKFKYIWVRLEGAAPRRAKVLKLPLDHVRILF